jgi:hypothetical protein
VGGNMVGKVLEGYTAHMTDEAAFLVETHTAFCSGLGTGPSASRGQREVRIVLPGNKRHAGRYGSYRRRSLSKLRGCVPSVRL